MLCDCRFNNNSNIVRWIRIAREQGQWIHLTDRHLWGTRSMLSWSAWNLIHWVSSEFLSTSLRRIAFLTKFFDNIRQYEQQWWWSGNDQSKKFPAPVDRGRRLHGTSHAASIDVLHTTAGELLLLCICQDIALWMRSTACEMSRFCLSAPVELRCRD